MKIVFASTPGQEEEINELVRHIYTTIFPIYFSDHEIKEYERIKVLYTSPQYFNDINTLKEGFQVMTSLQTIISILELSALDEQYTTLFNNNALSLRKFGLHFPFEFQQFVDAKNLKKNIFSIYTKAANELLV